MDGMPVTAELAQALAPWLADPAHAVLLDVDGTLAPIVLPPTTPTSSTAPARH
jgi:hypothetical protein